MTPAQHNKCLGLAHLGYGLMQPIAVALMLVIMWLMLTGRLDEPGQPSPEVPATFLVVMFGFASVVTIALAIPIFVGAYALLKRKPWAKNAGIVAGAVAAMNFPLGTGLAIYTFWFLFSDVGKQIYEKDFRVAQPPPPPTDWIAERG